MPAKVLLLSSVRWPSVARLAAGFAHAGCGVDALAPLAAAIVQSRYLARWHRYRPLFPAASMRRAIDDAKPDLLVCCDDRSLAQVLWLHAHSTEVHLRQLVERSLGNPGAIPRLIARAGFLAEAREEGIRVPETRAVTNRLDLEDALAMLGLPLVLKSDGSWGGEGVVVARTASEARAAFAKLAHPPSAVRNIARAFRRGDAHFLRDALVPMARNISAQKFIAGRPAASAFAAWCGDVVGDVYYDALVADEGIGPPNVIRRVECTEMKSATRKIAGRFGLSGIHGLDFMRDKDGAVHLIEINARATQGSTLAFGPGHDLPSALARCFDAHAGARPAIGNDVVVFFPREWRRDPMSPFIASGHHDVPWDDPAVLLACLGLPRKAIARMTPGRPGHEAALGAAPSRGGPEAGFGACPAARHNDREAVAVAQVVGSAATNR